MGVQQESSPLCCLGMGCSGSEQGQCLGSIKYKIPSGKNHIMFSNMGFTIQVVSNKLPKYFQFCVLGKWL